MNSCLKQWFIDLDPFCSGEAGTYHTIVIPSSSDRDMTLQRNKSDTVWQVWLTDGPPDIKFFLTVPVRFYCSVLGKNTNIAFNFPKAFENCKRNSPLSNDQNIYRIAFAQNLWKGASRHWLPCKSGKFINQQREVFTFKAEDCIQQQFFGSFGKFKSILCRVAKNF